MSIENCLDNAAAGGEISPQEAERLKRDYNRFRDNRANGGPDHAAAQAKADLLESIQAENAHKRRKAKIGMRKLQELHADLTTRKLASGERDLGRLALMKLENFGEMEDGFSSVAGRQKAIIGIAHAKMEEALYHFRRGAFGGDLTRWNKAQLDNVVKEAFGVSSDDVAAKGFAKAWADTAEWLRQRFNAAGGAIGKLENWGLPQAHDARALRKVGPQAWKDYIRPRLDAARMRHPLTGKAIDPRELDGILDEIWTRIATEGWSDREPMRQPFGRGALANQHAEHRFLVFRDPEAWMEYQRDFGQGDPFAAMMGHINMMAKDIAAMEVLGPNPSGTIEWMKQAIQREAQNASAGRPHRLGSTLKPEHALDKGRKDISKVEKVWASLRGDLSTPVNARAANVLSGIRSVVTASVLGSASLSALSDIGFNTLQRRFSGIAARNAVPQLIGAMLPSTRREAVTSGLILDSAMNVFHQQARYVGTLGGPEWASYLADRVLTYSGLTPWTQAARHAYGLAFQAETALNVGKAFDQLPEAFAKTFRRYGITGREWDLLRKAPLHEGRILRPQEIADRIDPRLAERYLEMILQDTEFAVPNSSHRAKTALLDVNQPGTLHGEFIRSFAQFKSFGAVVMILHGLRIHNMFASGQKAKGAAYTAGIVASTALLGAISVQLKQIAAGRDPQDMTPPSFWGAALLQGGGLGIYGDFLFADLNRFGGGFASTIAGPIVQRANDFWNLTAGNVVQLASGEKTHFGRELVRFARGNIPGGNIWYLKLAFERNVLDQLQRAVDPEADAAFRRRQQDWMRNTGQEFFWAPGETSPSRGPDWSNAAGGT